MINHEHIVGKIHTGAREYTVVCNGHGCREEFVDYLYSQKKFIQSLHGSDWRLRHGLWNCPTCSEKE